MCMSHIYIYVYLFLYIYIYSMYLQIYNHLYILQVYTKRTHSNRFDFWLLALFELFHPLSSTQLGETPCFFGTADVYKLNPCLRFGETGRPMISRQDLQISRFWFPTILYTFRGCQFITWNNLKKLGWNPESPRVYPTPWQSFHKASW